MRPAFRIVTGLAPLKRLLKNIVQRSISFHFTVCGRAGGGGLGAISRRRADPALAAARLARVEPSRLTVAVRRRRCYTSGGFFSQTGHI